MSKHSTAFKEYCIKNYNWDDIAKHFTTNVNLFLENKDFIQLREREYLPLELLS